VKEEAITEEKETRELFI